MPRAIGFSGILLDRFHREKTTTKHEVNNVLARTIPTRGVNSVHSSRDIQSHPIINTGGLSWHLFSDFLFITFCTASLTDLYYIFVKQVFLPSASFNAGFSRSILYGGAVKTLLRSVLYEKYRGSLVAPYSGFF